MPQCIVEQFEMLLNTQIMAIERENQEKATPTKDI